MVDLQMSEFRDGQQGFVVLGYCSRNMHGIKQNFIMVFFVVFEENGTPTTSQSW